MQRILIMAGGTGGHIFPGLALASALQSRNIDVAWLGTACGMESKLIPEANITLYKITISGLRGKHKLSLLFAPWKLMFSLYQAIKHLRQFKPNIVIGMGGYASGPGGVAAWLLRKKLLIHEQNALPGVTNRILAKLATRICESFPGSFPHGKKVIVTGNPVRDAITQLPKPQKRFIHHEKPLRLLVLGGSQGAKAINAIIPQVAQYFSQQAFPLQLEIWHQTGQRDYDHISRCLDRQLSNVTIEPFIQDMAKAYAWADIIFCRAGATTIAELCSVGIGSILVPYPAATDDHQTKNAQFLQKNLAAILMPQKLLSAESINKILIDFMKNREKILQMANAAYQLGNRRAVENVIQACYGMNDEL